MIITKTQKKKLKEDAVPGRNLKGIEITDRTIESRNIRAVSRKCEMDAKAKQRMNCSFN